jgi:hypothetical protein
MLPTTGRMNTPQPVPVSSPTVERIIFLSLLISLVVVVIGVDLAFRRWKKSSRSSSSTPGWLQLSKMLAGVASFYLTYWSLNYTIGSE